MSRIYKFLEYFEAISVYTPFDVPSQQSSITQIEKCGEEELNIIWRLDEERAKLAFTLSQL